MTFEARYAMWYNLTVRNMREPAGGSARRVRAYTPVTLVRKYQRLSLYLSRTRSDILSVIFREG